MTYHDSTGISFSYRCASVCDEMPSSSSVSVCSNSSPLLASGSLVYGSTKVDCSRTSLELSKSFEEELEAEPHSLSRDVAVFYYGL